MGTAGVVAATTTGPGFTMKTMSLGSVGLLNFLKMDLAKASAVG